MRSVTRREVDGVQPNRFPLRVNGEAGLGYVSLEKGVCMFDIKGVN